VPLCGSSWPHGRQSPPHLLVSGWQLDPYNLIPHKFSKHKGFRVPHGLCRLCSFRWQAWSNVYEVNTWLWNFGRGKPCLGGLTVEETAMRKETVQKDQAKRSAEIRRRKRADRAWSNEARCLVYVCTRTYLYIPVCTSMYHKLTKVE
jgi:hypothetical protein